MKQNLVFGFTFLFILFFSAILSGQEFRSEALPGFGDSTSFLVEYDPLPKKTMAQPVTPFYQHLYIFGDGNFRFSTSETKDTTQHLYRSSPATGFLPTYFPRAYSNGVYGEDDDLPPNNKIVVENPNSSLTSEPTHVVDSSRYLKILRNVEVKPGDNFVSILSVKNPNENFFEGNLYFFYDGRLREVTKKGERQLVDFGEFTIRENFAYQGNASESAYYYSNLPASNLSSRFRKMMVFRISELPPNEEIHLFLDMEGKETMMKYFADTVMAQLDFAVVLGSFDSDINVAIPDSLANKFSGLDLPNTFAEFNDNGLLPDSLKRYVAGTDSTNVISVSQGITLNLNSYVDYYESTATLVKSHDPNYLKMEACACEEDQDQYQIFTTIECENNGYGTTDHIFIDMKLPDGISADQVAQNPIRYHPHNGPTDKIKFIKLSDDSIRWELLDFGLEGTPVHGVGDPRTYARVQFNMYSSTAPASLSPVYACIRFDNVENAPVCTVPVSVTFVEQGGAGNDILSCGASGCSDIPPITPSTGLPWWLILLFVLLFLLLLIWLIRRNS